MKSRNWIRVFFCDMQLKYKLILSFLVLIVVPLVIHNILVYGNISKVLEDRIIFSASQAFKQTTDFVFYKINKLIDLSEQIAVNRELREILEKPLDGYTEAQQYEDLFRMRDYLTSLRNMEDVYDIRLYVRDEVAHSNVGSDIASFRDAQETVWYGQLAGADGNVLLCPPEYVEEDSGDEQKVLSLVRRIPGTQRYTDTIGYLRIDFLESHIHDILNSANTIAGSVTYVQNRDYRIVITTDDEMVSKYRVDLSALESLLGTEDWTISSPSGEKVYIRAKQIDNTDWTVMTAIPADCVFREIVMVNGLMTLFLAVIAMISVALSVFISVNISRRLHRLSQKMTMVTENVFEEYIDESDSHDEIGELSQNYNYMVRRISKMAKEQYESGQELKNVELKALQAQINPHFLYNTLDMINWMSYEDKGAEIRKIIKSLSVFYKLSLSKGNSIIPLRDELRHVSMYMDIQNCRLQDAITFSIDCPEKLKDCTIPKITLQPIVENAILHGIQAREHKSGDISITVTEQEGYLNIAVRDNGVGISPEKLGDVFDYESKRGFGLKNINTRLMLMYDHLSGISIESRLDEETVVTVRLLKLL